MSDNRFDIEGKVLAVFETKEISDRFSKREFVIEADDGRYSQTLMFEGSGRAMEDLDAVKEGDEIRVHFNIRGREWRSPAGETKYFVSLHAWKIERFGAEKPKQPAVAKSKSNGGGGQAAPPADDAPPIDDSDIPF